MKAVILAGGRGTRFAPLTDTIPKALVPIKDRSILEMALDTLPEAIDTVIITTNYLGETIEKKLGSSYKGKTLLYTPQSKEMSGTWAAFYAAKEHIGENELFCVFGCDDLYDKHELEAIFATKKIGMGITETQLPAKYHRVLIDTGGYVQGLERHPNIDREELVTDQFANGFFLLDAKAFSFEPVKLIDGEYGLPQTLLAHKDTYPLFAHHMNDWQPCNTFEDIKKIHATNH